MGVIHDLLSRLGNRRACYAHVAVHTDLLGLHWPIELRVNLKRGLLSMRLVFESAYLARKSWLHVTRLDGIIYVVSSAREMVLACCN